MRIRLMLLGLTVAIATPAFAQAPNPRAAILASEFSKFKNETRTKKGLSHTKYKEVIAEAWVAHSAAYAGRYLAEDPVSLEISVDANGNATGSGRDHARFELRNLAIAAGLITGTKVYSGGRSEKFEAVFLKRSSRESADASFTVRYGIGLLADLPQHGVSDLRVFAEKL